MALKLRSVQNADEEYPGCVILPEKRTVTFKVECWSDLAKAAEKHA